MIESFEVVLWWISRFATLDKDEKREARSSLAIVIPGVESEQICFKRP